MTDHFGKFKTSTYLPSDDNAPEFIKQLYAKPALDFDPASVKPDELNTIESLTHDLCLDFTIYSQLFADQESRDKAYTLRILIYLNTYSGDCEHKFFPALGSAPF